jgi:hypothetical protein
MNVEQYVIQNEAPWLEITTMAPRQETSYHDPCCCPVIPFASPSIASGKTETKR